MWLFRNAVIYNWLQIRKEKKKTIKVWGADNNYFHHFLALLEYSDKQD